MTKPPFEVADIIRAHGNSFVQRNRSWLAALLTAIQMATERCRAAMLDGEEHAELQPCQCRQIPRPNAHAAGFARAAAAAWS
jgi:hypothetical protein